MSSGSNGHPAEDATISSNKAVSAVTTDSRNLALTGRHLTKHSTLNTHARKIAVFHGIFKVECEHK